MMALWPLPAVFLGALLITWGLRRYALLRNVLDIPNSRSSHTQPTPRGGGLAIVLAFSLALPWASWMGALSMVHLWALVGAGWLVALAGFVDDHLSLGALWRLLAHFVAAIWALVFLGGAPDLLVLGVAVDLGWIGFALAVLYLVWLLNLYNFMDGIDGLAGIEALTVGLGAALLYAWLGLWDALLLPVALALAAGGFLVWNFPPARIFMGDAGSGYLGLIIGMLSLQAALIDPGLLWVWLILLGVFIVDATLTLGRRLARGERIYEAHRSHAYQHAARHYGRHLPVTLAVAAINIFWLLPIACWVAQGGEGLAGVFLAYLPLIWLALYFRAGVDG
ncbi:glycosyl transferase [Pseudomonas sp. L-22-4S-12]|uniref:MraY family glycosyltransferase n=1 Tax=Pseudomonas sp. L-22-4S-12 TaxID=2610893 RepID=UPI0013262998|nr:glycosyltransferase family 4 protein [Pseudomonas sp. L-22-4S-12]MWV18085.1 glycosyl transferase [Pseudomonas sp. L-22-4S-12]